MKSDSLVTSKGVKTKEATIPRYLVSTLHYAPPGLFISHQVGVAQGSAICQHLYDHNSDGEVQALCKDMRKEACDEMLVEAAKMGANAVLSMRYEFNSIGDAFFEVLCYGTGVVLLQGGYWRGW